MASTPTLARQIAALGAAVPVPIRNRIEAGTSETHGPPRVALVTKHEPIPIGSIATLVAAVVWLVKTGVAYNDKLVGPRVIARFRGAKLNGCVTKATNATFGGGTLHLVCFWIKEN